MSENETTLKVVVELYENNSVPIDSTASKKEKIAQQKQAFKAGLDAVTGVILQRGGKLLDSTWINRSVLVEIPISTLTGITDLPQVASVDTPRMLTTD